MKRVMSIVLNLLPVIFLARTITGCIAYTGGGEVIRMELPAYDSSANIIEYTGYTVSFDDNSKLPVWVDPF